MTGVKEEEEVDEAELENLFDWEGDREYDEKQERILRKKIIFGKDQLRGFTANVL